MKFERKTGLGWASLVGLGLTRVAMGACVVGAGVGVWHLVDGGVIDVPNKDDYPYKIDPGGTAYDAAASHASAEVTLGINWVGYSVLGGFCAYAADVVVAAHATRRPEDTQLALGDADIVVAAGPPLPGAPGAV